MPLIDMGQAEVFEAVPAAIYDASLSKYEYISVEESQNAKDDYVKLEFDIIDGEYVGRKQWRNYSVSPKALGYLKKAMIALGASPEDVSETFDPDEVFPDLIGNECRIVVGVREYEGEETNEVKKVLPAA